MTPSEVKDEVADIQSRLRALEIVLDTQKKASPAYREMSFEIAEAWEGIERVAEMCDAETRRTQ